MMPALLLRMTVRLDWSAIETLREAIHRIVSVALGEDDGIALAMVSSELLENAVKYGGDGVISLWIEQETDRVVVHVVNRVDEGAPHSARLREQLGWLRSFGDPARAYLAALQRVFERRSEALDEARLGLARIAFEGGCDLVLEDEGTDHVAVRAVRARTSPAETRERRAGSSARPA
jgi:hypothetical protein